MYEGNARIRLFIVKENDLDFEVLKYDLFKDELYSTPIIPKKELAGGRYADLLGEMEVQESTTLTDEQWIQSNIDNIGWDGVRDDINEILKSYATDDVVEILADYCIKASGGNSGWEYDDYEEEEWLEKIQHNKLRDPEIARYIGPFKRNKDNLIEFIHDYQSFNHGEEK